MITIITSTIIILAFEIISKIESLKAIEINTHKNIIINAKIRTTIPFYKYIITNITRITIIIRIIITPAFALIIKYI